MPLKPKSSLALALLGLALAASPAAAVSGGTTLLIAQAPYVAWLGGSCTGTLITPTRILTAGHCLDGQSATNADVLVGVDGNVFRADPSLPKPRPVAVAGYSVDPKFKESFPFAHDNPRNAIAVDDVGLILLKHPVTGIAPVRLAGAADAALQAPGAAVTLVGYGLTAEIVLGGPPVPILPLQQGALSVLDPGSCAQSYPHAIQPSMLCTDDLAQHTPLIQACPGDSGGPTLAMTPTGPVQIGVTSWGAEVMNGECGKSRLPEVSMRVSDFAAFITKAKPAIEPASAGTTRIEGVPRIGDTVTCKAPKFTGDGIKLTYSWQVTANLDVPTLPGKHARTLKVTQDVYRRAVNPHLLFCTATATNAGGSLPMMSGSVRIKRY